MSDDEKLKKAEVAFEDGEEQKSTNQPLSQDYVEKIFSLEHEMLLSIDDYISPETKNVIVDKISRQNKTLMSIANNELKTQEKINNQSKPAIDGQYFNKKSLNINNI